MNSSTARHNSESYPEEVVTALEQYPKHSLVEKPQDMDITSINNGPTEVKKVFTKKRKIKKPLEYSNDKLMVNWHEHLPTVGIVVEFLCAFCNLNSTCESWKEFSEVAEFSKEKGRQPDCKTCRRSGSMHLTSSKLL